MSDSNTQKAIQQFLAAFRRLLSTGRQVAVEDALRAVRTPEGFDRRGVGPYVAAMKRDGEIIAVGFRTSDNAKHHAGIKRLWVSASIQQKRGAAQ